MFKIGCQAHVTARTSADGQVHEIKSFDKHHNHETNRKLFKNLPQQRKLPIPDQENTRQMVDTKANKIIQATVLYFMF